MKEKKHILIFALSTFGREMTNREGKISSFQNEEMEKPEEYWYQLEPVPFYLHKVLGKENSEHKIDEILVLCTEKTLEKREIYIGHNEPVCHSPYSYIKKAIEEMDSIIVVSDPFVLNEYQAQTCLSELVEYLIKENEQYDLKISMDTHGGFRGIQLMLEAISTLINNYGIHVFPENIWSFDIGRRRVFRDSNGFKVFEFVSAINEFINFGKCTTLKVFIEHEIEYQKKFRADKERATDFVSVKAMLEAIIDFSNAISICNMREIEEKVLNIEKEIKNIEELAESELDNNMFTLMLKQFLPIFEKKMHIETVGGGCVNYPGLISWCVEHDLIQQALTLYQEKIPKYCYSKGFLTFNEPPSSEMGKSKELIAFSALYDEFLYDLDYLHLKRVIQSLPEKGSRDWDNYYDFIKSRLNHAKTEDPMIADAIDKMKKTVINYYYRNDGTKKTTGSVKFYGKKVGGSNLEKYINNIKKSYLKMACHYFLGHSESECMISSTKDKKKAISLCNMKKDHLNSQFNHMSQEELFEILKYHLAVTILRNQINHASEDELNSDTIYAIDHLKNEFDVDAASMDIVTIKKLLNEAIDAVVNVKYNYPWEDIEVPAPVLGKNIDEGNVKKLAQMVIKYFKDTSRTREMWNIILCALNNTYGDGVVPQRKDVSLGGKKTLMACLISAYSGLFEREENEENSVSPFLVYKGGAEMKAE